MMTGLRTGQCRLIFGSPPRFGACCMPPGQEGPQRFSCQSHAISGGVTRVWLSGEIGESDAREIDAALRAAQDSAAMVIVDARGVVATDATVVELIRAADGRAGD